MARFATKFTSFDGTLALAGLLLVAPLTNSAWASGLDCGATASGYDYLSIEEPSGTVVGEAGLLYSTGGGGVTLAAGNGVSGAGSAADAPVYSYANLATGTVYATGNWSTEYVSNPNNLQVGPTIGNASLYDTIVGFTNAPAGAIGQLVINAPVAEINGLGQISETASISNGAGGYGAGLTQTLLPTGGTLSSSSTVAGYCNCTTTGGWTTSVSIPFQIVAGVSLGIAEIDPTWSLVLPAGVSYTTASGDMIGGTPVPLPRSVLIPRRKILAGSVPG